MENKKFFAGAILFGFLVLSGCSQPGYNEPGITQNGSQVDNSNFGYDVPQDEEDEMQIGTDDISPNDFDGDAAPLTPSNGDLMQLESLDQSYDDSLTESENQDTEFEESEGTDIFENSEISEEDFS